MRAAILALAGTLLGASAAAQGPTREQIVRYAAQAAQSTWRKVEQAPERLSARELFVCALALCEAGEQLDRLPRLFELAAQFQDRDRKSRGYGNFRWYWPDERVMDFNAVEFCMQSGALIWLRHKNALPRRAREALREILEYAIEGCLRHRVRPSYTNIALMNAENLILLGEALGKREVADEGYARLANVLVDVWENGTHEYCSPTYYGVDLDCLELIEAFCQRAEGREQARALLRLLWTDVAANWFPPAQRLAGAHSRDYRYLLGTGPLETHLWAFGWLAGAPRGGATAVYPALARWRPPEQLRELCRRFPRLVRQSWGPAWYQSRTHYLLAEATLSASGANYGPMDLPLTVDLPGGWSFPRCYFIPDARGDPYGKKKILAGKGPHHKALHLRPFFCAAQRATDALALVVYRPGDLPQPLATVQSHFVMPRGADEFWLGQRRVRFGQGEPKRISVALGEALCLRKGGAAVGVRVLWARDVAGGAVELALVDDGNPYGAVRLSATHYAGTPRQVEQSLAAAVLWVRIGGGLEGDGAFAAWRKRFSAAQGSVSAQGGLVRASVEGEAGPVSLCAREPFREPEELLPRPSEAVLELDGRDIGRPLLEAVEPVRSFIAALRGGPVVRVPRMGAGVFWEAEQGAILPQMVVGRDERASGGRFVWMPGAIGEARTGSGRAVWRLDVARAGQYFLWGRVLAPTPQDDSFYVRVEAAERTVVGEWHTGVHKSWQWAPVALNRSAEPTAFYLPKGEVRVELRVREDGTKIDRLFLASSSREKPQ